MAKDTLDKKQKFIHELAKYLVGNSAEKSIKLQMETKEGKEWANLLNHTPIFGWKTIEEAEEILTDFLR